MAFNRRVLDMKPFLLIIGTIVTAALSGHNNKIGVNLDCTNDYGKTMSCQFKAQNCSEYALTLRSTDYPGRREVHCKLEQCHTGLCCCSAEISIVPYQSNTATLQKGVQSEKFIFSVLDTAKPNKPAIVSVKESNGNYEVLWKTNCDRTSFTDGLNASVTYHKKGDTNEVTKFIKPTTVNELNYYEILGKDLEPRTAYLVRVKSHTGISDLYSESSEEYEFTTPASRKLLLLAVIVSLSVVAVIISGVIYCCYVKLKTKWWDTISECQNPKLLLMHPSEQELLKPMPPIISSISVEPFVPDDSNPWSKESLMGSSSGSLQQTSGISTGSSSLSYANTEPADIIAGVQEALGKAFANISPISPVTTSPLTASNNGSGLFSTPYDTCDVKADDLSFGSSGFDNKTYSIVIPSHPCQTVMDNQNQSIVQTQVEMLCDSAYHPSEGDTCLNQQVPACPVPVLQDLILPPVVSSLMPIDMAYQCNVDSGRFSSAEDSSLSSMSSGTNTTASCDLASRVENFDEVLRGATKPDGKSEEVTICDENPCVPASSHSFPPVDDDYQAFQTLVKQPDILFSEQRSGEEEEPLDRYPEKSFTNIPQSFLSPVLPAFTNDVQGGRCLSELQRPFLSLIPADQSMPVMTDSGYQSVQC